ncbi:hypothetical protein BSKO_03866 [Bryopsis sp. KO-2023]|nr:hypothetical protein BSKO_03866 [Bryopsis sp. KO-2023]
MAVSTAEATISETKGPLGLGDIQVKWNNFMQKQSPPVEVAIGTFFGCLQGGVLGYAMGSLTKNSMATMQNNPAAAAANPMASQFTQMGGVWGQARGLAALCGVSAGLSITLKKWRGKEDVWTQMGSAAGGGAAFTIASGNLSIPAIVNTSLLLGLVSGGFYKLSESFKGDTDEADFQRGRYMLETLGLGKFSKNLKKGQLSDNTIMLWNDSALQEARIPPGPRLLILHHLDQVRDPAKSAKKSSKQITAVAPAPPSQSTAAP